MIDIKSEELISLKDAAKACPTLDGKKPHLSTLWRWIAEGAQGRKLEHVRLGRRVVTSREALHRFMKGEGEPIVKSARPEIKETPKRRQREIDEAAARLAARGCAVA